MVADPRCDVLPCAGNCGASVCRNDDCADDAHATAHLIGGRYYCPDCADGAELRWLRAECARLWRVNRDLWTRLEMTCSNSGSGCPCEAPADCPLAADRAAKE